MQALRNALLFLRMALFAAAVPWLFRLPIRRLERWVDARPSAYPPNSGDAGRIVRYTAGLCRAARPLLAHPCQVRGLTLYYFLRRAGVDVSLVFGVGKVDDLFAGHCWLVRDGEPYLETTDPRAYFTQIYAFHGAAAPGPEQTLTASRNVNA